jgi:[calcium/calmodulin-dependent protein kinase] kinase
MKGSVGTYYFFAPELCNPDVTEYSGCAADIWALGVTLYCLVYNKLPTEDKPTFEIMEDILNNEIVLGNRKISDGLKGLIMSCLEKDPVKRIKLKALLNHQWINEGYEGSLHLGEEGYELVADLKSTTLLS